jgi:branched-chain amino acid transport system ATP-binding protein
MADPSAPVPTPLLELRDIDSGYAQTIVVRNISLSVPAGAAVALLGANGAGKTTILRTAAGLVRPVRGQVFFDGDDVTKLAAAERAQRGMCLVPEGRGIFPSLTVRDTLTLFGRKRNRKDTIDRAVDAFPKLAGRLSQVTGTLSGGEQQMLSLARAYVTEPRLVLVDEASIGLAPLIVDQIFEFLARLVADSVSILLVEQYASRAFDIASWVVVVEHGAVAFTGKPSEIDQGELYRAYLGTDPTLVTGVAGERDHMASPGG